ncbi:MAG: class F sortase [Chloroflexi bacterium]|nr:class F sortase [Chloroflexota bacterium]
MSVVALGAARHVVRWSAALAAALALLAACQSAESLVVEEVAARSPPAAEGTALATPPPRPATAPPRRARPAPTATPVPRQGSPAVRISIARIGIDARVVTLGVDRNGVMQSPDSPSDVAWYDFSALPGGDGNAVLSGHLDWYTGITGVFWRVKELAPGDAVEITTADGRQLRYIVVETTVYQSATVPVARVVGPTPYPSVTLVTCEGRFDRATRDYSHRRVVRAELEWRVTPGA